MKAADEGWQGITLRFADVLHSAAFMKFVEGKLTSDQENCAFKAADEDDLDRWKKMYMVPPKGAGDEPERKTLLLVFVGVRYHLVSLDGRRATYVVTEVVFHCGNSVTSQKLEPTTSQNSVVTPGRTKAPDNSRSIAYLSNFIKNLSLKLLSSDINGCLFMFSNPDAARAFIKWAEALRMLPELCNVVSYIGFNRKTSGKKIFLRNFPAENSVVETSLHLGTLFLSKSMKTAARTFYKNIIKNCQPARGIEKLFPTIWGGVGRVAFVDLKFVNADSASGDPVIIQIGLSIQNGHADHDQLFCCLPTETTTNADHARPVPLGQAMLAPSEASMLEEFIRALAAAHTSVVICTASDYFALSLLVGKVFRHGLETAFLDVVVGHFDLVAAASFTKFQPADLTRATRCGIASPASVWEAVFPETESPWVPPGSPGSPPSHVLARNLGKMVKATVPNLTQFARDKARATDELRLGEGDAAVELRVKLIAREIQPGQTIQLMVLLSPEQEAAMKVRQCVVFTPHGRKGQIALTDFKVCEGTGNGKAVSFLATNTAAAAVTLAEDELLGFVRSKPGGVCVAPHDLYRDALEPHEIYDVNTGVCQSVCLDAANLYHV